MFKTFTLQFLTAILFSLFTFNLSAQDVPLQFDHLANENGLLNSTVNCIAQDHSGYMWFGTDNGLYRYDGYEFRTFKHDPKNPRSLRNNAIRNLLVASDGTLFIGQIVGAGLSYFDPQKEEFIYVEKGKTSSEDLISNNVYSLYEDMHHMIWIGTSNGGLHSYDPRTKKMCRYQFFQPKLRINNNITGIVEDRDGTLYIASQGILLCTFDRKQSTFLAINDKYTQQDNSISNDKTLLIDGKGDLWISTLENGLFLYNKHNKTFQQFKKIDHSPNGLSSNTLTRILEDNDGRLWICSDGGGLNIFDPKSKTFSIYHHNPADQNSLSTNALYCIYKDRTGIIWIGTYNGGVNIYNKTKNKFRTYTQDIFNPQSLSYKSVFMFYQDADENIWIGTDGGGLNLYNPQKYGDVFIKYLNAPSSTGISSNYVVKCIYDDKKGNLLLGTWNNGVGIFNKKTGQCKQWKNNPNDPNSPSGNNIWYIFEDSKERIWISILGYGLDLYDKNLQLIEHIPAYGPSLLSSSTIKVIFEDSQHQLWFGTDAGGCSIYNEKEKHFSVLNTKQRRGKGLNNKTVRAIYEDKDHNVWLGTDGGGINLYHRKTATFTYIQDADGLPSNSISSIVSDDDDNIWISTDNGISKYDPIRKTFRNYDRFDGLQGNEFTYASCLKAKDGRIYFGGINGFNSFLPKEIKYNTEKPNVLLTDFLIFNQSVRINDETKVLKKAIQHTDTLHLSYDHSVISFKFAALSYTHPEKNQYAYCLENFDKKWNYVGNKREATYTNLNPGEYIFKVKAANNDGVWNERYASIRVIVYPPFWKARWFRIMLLIVYVVVSYYLYLYLRYRFNRQRAKQQQLELMKQLEIENELKEEAERAEKEVIRLRNEKLEIELSTVEAEKKITQLEHDKLKTELRHKKKELTSLALNITKKTDFLNNLKNEVADIMKHIPVKEANQITNKINSLIDSNINSKEDWNMFELHFDSVYENFIFNLKKANPDLKPWEVRLCVYIKMNLSNKEIASLMNITANSVAKNKLRLKDSLNMPEGLKLSDFIRNFNTQ